MGRFPEALTAYDEAVQAHPESVVAKNGRAEVLKAMGRLEEALDAYVEIQHKYPQNRVATNGLASVLVEQGKLDEALPLVTHDEHISVDDWIDEHVRAMIFLYQGKLLEAAALFERGVNVCPFIRSKAYCRTSLAATRIRLAQLDEATRLVDEVDAAELAEPVLFLRTQLCGVQSEFDRASESFWQLSPPRTVVERELFGELELRFVNRQPGRHDDDWLLRQQVRFQTEHLRRVA